MAGGIILFDGTCAFCVRSVRFIATRDSGYFKFGASQNPDGLRELSVRLNRGVESSPEFVCVERAAVTQQHRRAIGRQIAVFLQSRRWVTVASRDKSRQGRKTSRADEFLLNMFNIDHGSNPKRSVVPDRTSRSR